jgi:hypothetical protein
MRITYCIAVLVLVVSSFASLADELDAKLTRILTEDQQSRLDLKSLSATQKQALFDSLASVYSAGRDEAREEATKSARAAAAASAIASSGVIETKVDGEFQGWEGETVVKLMNGQIWQQSEYYYRYHYAYMPNALIYKAGSGHKMKVDGIDKAVGVTRLR